MESPAVYWVIGLATNVGKTTIATELIRYLARRELTVGFKPYGGIQLLQSYEFLCEASASGYQDQILFGRDAIALCSASNVTDETDLEVIAPSYRLSYPDRRNTLLMRRGSAKLNNRGFLQCVADSSIFLRQDIKILKSLAGLPLGDATSVSLRKTPEQMDALGRIAAKAAFEHLCQRGIASIVCEGSGLLLPAWTDEVRCNHIILVDREKIHFFPSIDLKTRGIDHVESIPDIKSIDDVLRRAKNVNSTDHLLCTIDKRSEVYEKIFLEWRV